MRLFLLVLFMAEILLHAKQEQAIYSQKRITIMCAGIQGGKTTSGAVWMRRLTDHFDKVVWLNPEPERVWSGTQSIQQARQLVQERMYPLTIKGIEEGMKYLSK